MMAAFRRLGLPLLLFAMAAVLPAHAKEPVAKKPRVLVTISKETTYITEPLRKDGYLDYVAALNQRASQGVTPENNAAVLFWKAVGPGEINKADREKYFQMLGIPPLPEKGEYFIDLDEYVSRHANATKNAGLTLVKEPWQDTWKQLEPIMKRPWSKQEYPVFAEWLAANEKPLALLVQVSKRSRYYDPLVCGEKTPLLAATEPISLQFRVTARTLVVRAMLRLHDGKVAEVWKDLLTCHRLARLVAQGPTVMEGLSARKIDQMANMGDQALLQNIALSAEHIRQLRKDIVALPPFPKMVEHCLPTERFVFLDAMAMIARDGFSSVGRIDRGESKSMVRSLADSIGSSSVDWDSVLRDGNSYYDRTSDAVRLPTPVERMRAWNKIAIDIRKLRQASESVAFFGLSMLADPRKAFSKRIVQTFVPILFRLVFACLTNDDDGTMQVELNQLAFALAQYRAEQGSYPTKLADLAPKYIMMVPKDVFSNDADLHYSREGKGYLLYSVGRNGKDDGGKGYDDCKEDEDFDDLIVRMPAP